MNTKRPSTGPLSQRQTALSASPPSSAYPQLIHNLEKLETARRTEACRAIHSRPIAPA
jgi:hypothetical protein